MNAPPALGYPPGVSLAQSDSVSPTAANFGSNNPFRNRALSPSSGSAGSSRPERPRSTNPFLDDSEALSPQSAPSMSTGAMISPTSQTDITNNTRDLFENLSIKVAPAAPVAAPPQSNGARPTTSGGQRPPPRQSSNRSRPPRERSDRPVEPRAKDPKDPFDIFADPPALAKSSTSGPRGDARPRRPRRNSESSVMDRASKLFDDDDEKRRRERRKEREARHRDRDGKPRSSRKDRRLDIIDKLDVTSIYGTGMFHHDGPFDACNPHRNRKGARTAPMQAFPKGSLNMALGGAGPNNPNINLNQFHGRQEEAYTDFTAAPKNQEAVPFDAATKLEPVHGSESMGLGTSTFLDGAPASRSAMARRQSENDDTLAPGGGLTRKKSLAQRLRGKSGTGRVGSPDPKFSSTLPAVGSSASSSSNKATEPNPYFQEYDEDADRKGFGNPESRFEGTTTGRARALSSPKQSTALDRSSEDMRSPPAGGGFLNRMKSLRKPRPERRPSD